MATTCFSNFCLKLPLHATMLAWTCSFSHSNWNDLLWNLDLCYHASTNSLSLSLSLSCGGQRSAVLLCFPFLLNSVFSTHVFPINSKQEPKIDLMSTEVHNPICFLRYWTSPTHAPLIVSVVRLSVYLSACLSVCLSLFLYFGLSVCLSVCLSICILDCLSVCLSVCWHQINTHGVVATHYTSVYQSVSPSFHGYGKVRVSLGLFFFIMHQSTSIKSGADALIC